VKKLLASVALTGAALVSAHPARAQQAAAPPAGTPAPNYSANVGKFGMAVVDVSYIFKSYAKFTQQIEGLKEQMKTADADLKVVVDQLAAKEQQRDGFKPGTAEFKQIDEQLARDKADFSISKAPCVATSWSAKPRSTTRPTRKFRPQSSSSPSAITSAWCCGSTAIRSTRSSART
jgi:hypothetical protein